MRGPFLGVPVIRIIVSWGLCWGPGYLGKLPSVSSLGFRLCAPHAYMDIAARLRSTPTTDPSFWETLSPKP